MATAIRQEIDELDEEDEEQEFDLRQTLELVTFTGPELLGKVSIAGTYLGEISIAIIRVFAKEEQSTMQALQALPDLPSTLYDNPFGEV